MKARYVLVLANTGLLVPARADALPVNAKTFRTVEHAERLAEKLNADLSAEAVADDFGPGAGEARS